MLFSKDKRTDTVPKDIILRYARKSNKDHSQFTNLAPSPKHTAHLDIVLLL